MLQVASTSAAQGDEQGEQNAGEQGGDMAAGLEDQGEAPPDTAPQARNAQQGAASSGQQGTAAPMAGGQGPQPPQQPQAKGHKKKPEANPFRNLGDALERWKANLSVTQEAPPPKADEDSGVAQVSEMSQEVA